MSEGGEERCSCRRDPNAPHICGQRVPPLAEVSIEIADGVRSNICECGRVFESVSLDLEDAGD